MEKCRLDNETWLAFLENRLSGEERKNLIAHLGEDCPDCESFLSEIDPEELDSAIIKACEGLGNQVESRYAPDGAERSRMFDSIMEKSRKRPSVLHVNFNWKPVAALAACLLLVAIFALKNDWFPASGEPMGGSSKTDKVKGPEETSQSILLQVAVLKHNAGSLERGMRGEMYEPDDILFFRYEIENDGYVYIVRTDGKIVEHLYGPDESYPVAQKKGIYEFREGGKAQGFRLEGLKGRQMFFAISSSGPMDFKNEIKPLIKRYMEKDGQEVSENWAFDSFEITVAGKGD